MSNTYPDGAPQTPYGDPNNASGAEGAPEPQPTQAFPPVPVVPLPGQGAGAPTGAPAAPYGQGGAPYGGAPTPRTASRSPGRRAAPSRMDTRRRRMGRNRERTDSRALAPHTTRVGLLMVSSLNPVRTPSASPMAELRMVARRLPPHMDSHTAPTSTVTRNTGTSRPQSRRKATAIRTSRNRRRRRAAARSSPASPPVSLPSSPSSS